MVRELVFQRDVVMNLIHKMRILLLVTLDCIPRGFSCYTGYTDRKTLDEGRSEQRSKRCEINNKDEHNNPSVNNVDRFRRKSLLMIFDVVNSTSLFCIIFKKKKVLLNYGCV